MLPRTFVKLNYLFKISNWVYKEKRGLAAHAHRTNYAMDKIYLQNEAGSPELHMHFRYVNADLKLDRNFEFCRKMDEKVGTALMRIRINIEKELNKKKLKKANKSAILIPSEINVEFLSSSGKLEDVTFSEMLRETSDNLHFKILDCTYSVAVNHPWVVNLVLPTSIMAGAVLYPRKLNMQFAELTYCKIQWHKAKMSNKIKETSWEHCGDGFLYFSSNDDVNHYLKMVFTPGNSKGILGPPVHCVVKNEILPGPGHCPFETRHFFTKNQLFGDAFRVVSYNLLADTYADSTYARSNLFPYCSPHALKIDYRKQLFIKEIIGYNSDILCLQEVDMKIFKYDLMPVLENIRVGFKGVIAEKGTSGEGIVTFYRSDRFELIKSFNLNIGDNIKTLDIFSELWEKIKSNDKLVERICDLSTTLQLNLLKSTNDYYVLVANTHLYFHPDACHIRLLQIGFSMLYINHIYTSSLEKYNINKSLLSLIFCGDFNCVPESGVYQLMTQRFVDENCVDWKSKLEEAVQDVSLKQPFDMQSACGTPEYTNFTHTFSACLDYIFFQSDVIDVQQIVPLPSKDELAAHVAIPSVVFPSDHVALVADFKFKASV